MYVVMVTKMVLSRKHLEQYSRPRVNGINAIEIREDDQLLEAKLTTGTSEIMIGTTKGGKCIRFPEEKVRAVGRSSIGVRGVDLSDGDEVIGMIVVNDIQNETVLVVSRKDMVNVPQ